MVTSFDRGGDLGGSIRVAWRSGLSIDGHGM